MSASSKSPKLAVIDYGMGNLRSVLKAWQSVGADAYLIQTPEEAESADALVFPGQGAIVDTMQLLAKTGLDQLIKDWIQKDRPFFGICLGFQALFEFSEEGDTQGLGIFEGSVKQFPPATETQLKVPHMGWNQIRKKASHPMFEDIRQNDRCYFVHSYYVEAEEASVVVAETDYGLTFHSALSKDNIFAVQFHPEKSHKVGLQLLKNFSKWKP